MTTAERLRTATISTATPFKPQQDGNNSKRNSESFVYWYKCARREVQLRTGVMATLWLTTWTLGRHTCRDSTLHQVIKFAPVGCIQQSQIITRTNSRRVETFPYIVMHAMFFLHVILRFISNTLRISLTWHWVKGKSVMRSELSLSRFHQKTHAAGQKSQQRSLKRGIQYYKPLGQTTAYSSTMISTYLATSACASLSMLFEHTHAMNKQERMKSRGPCSSLCHHMLYRSPDMAPGLATEWQVPQSYEPCPPPTTYYLPPA